MATYLFDFGDTLVHYYRLIDFEPILRSGIRRVGEYLETTGFTLPSDEVVRVRTDLENRESSDFAVRPLEDRLARIFGFADGLPASIADEASRRFLEPIFDSARLDPEALELLEALKSRGDRIGVVSNTPWGSPASLWRQEVARHGVDQFSDAIVFCRDVGHRKPHPALFQRAARLTETDPAACTFIGDHLHHDVEGSIAAGMIGVLIDRFDFHTDWSGRRIGGLMSLLGDE